MNKKRIVKMLIKLQRYDRGGRKTPTKQNNHFSSSFLKWVNFNEKMKNERTKMLNLCSASDAYDISCCEKWGKFILLTPYNRCLRCTWFCGCIQCLTCLLIALPLSSVVMNYILKHRTNVTNSSICLHILNRNATE